MDAKLRALGGAAAVKYPSKPVRSPGVGAIRHDEAGPRQAGREVRRTYIARRRGQGRVRGAAVEGAEELAQNPIEQVASYQDPTTQEAIKDTLFGGAMGPWAADRLAGSWAARPMPCAVATRAKASHFPNEILGGVPDAQSGQASSLRCPGDKLPGSGETSGLGEQK